MFDPDAHLPRINGAWSTLGRASSLGFDWHSICIHSCSVGGVSFSLAGKGEER
jgi:hypothetical protein